MSGTDCGRACSPSRARPGVDQRVEEPGDVEGDVPYVEDRVEDGRQDAEGGQYEILQVVLREPRAPGAGRAEDP